MTHLVSDPSPPQEVTAIRERWRQLPRSKRITAVAFIATVALLLFARLGTYALWDDEANTALFGMGVWRTGDTSAVIGSNVVAYRSGVELRGLVNRYFAPLQYYVAAPFSGLFAPSAFAPRFPFAVLGVCAALLAVFWLWKDDAPLHQWLLVAMGAIGNVSLLLYMRQARYYALSTLLTLLIVCIYTHWDGRKRLLIGLAASSVALLATHYIAYAALAVTLATDYVLFGWRRRRFTWRDLAILAGVNLLAGGLIVATWNPFNKPLTRYVPDSWVADKATLWWWNLRDLNACEFGATVLLAVAPILYFLRGRADPLLVRLPIAIAVYNAAVSAASPQPVGLASVADIRYLQPTIPAFIYLGVATLSALHLTRDWPRIALGALLFLTNVVNAGTARIVGGDVFPYRSTLVHFAGELRNPPPGPYHAAADWLNRNVPPGRSAWVRPDYAVYPLMYHAPHLTYAWQFEPRIDDESFALPQIHFKWREAPDYLIAFGADVREVRRVAESMRERGARYEQAAYLPVHFPDLTRPELFWHSFTEFPLEGRERDGVFVFAIIREGSATSESFSRRARSSRCAARVRPTPLQSADDRGE